MRALIMKENKTVTCVNTITKEIVGEDCYLNVDGIGYKMAEYEADRFIRQMYELDKIDLTEYTRCHIPILR